MHEAVRPGMRFEVGMGNEFACPLDQQSEDVPCPAADPHVLAVAQQQLAVRDETESVERERVFRRRRLTGCPNFHDASKVDRKAGGDRRGAWRACRRRWCSRPSTASSRSRPGGAPPRLYASRPCRRVADPGSIPTQISRDPFRQCLRNAAWKTPTLAAGGRFAVRFEMSAEGHGEFGRLEAALMKARERLVRVRFAVGDARAIRAAEELVLRAEAALDGHRAGRLARGSDVMMVAAGPASTGSGESPSTVMAPSGTGDGGPRRDAETQI